MTPSSMRFVFFASAAGVAAVSGAFVFYFNTLRCDSVKCNVFDFSSMSSGLIYLLFILPLTIIVPLLVLGWLMGRKPPRRGGQSSDTHNSES